MRGMSSWVGAPVQRTHRGLAPGEPDAYLTWGPDPSPSSWLATPGFRLLPMRRSRVRIPSSPPGNSERRSVGCLSASGSPAGRGSRFTSGHPGMVRSGLLLAPDCNHSYGYSLRWGIDRSGDDEGAPEGLHRSPPGQTQAGPRTDSGSVPDQAPADLSVERASSRPVPGPAGAARPGAVAGPGHLLHPLEVVSAQAPVLRRSAAGSLAVDGPDAALWHGYRSFPPGKRDTWARLRDKASG